MALRHMVRFTTVAGEVDPSAARSVCRRGPVPEPDHAVAERLAEIAPVDILGAVGILDKMIHGDRQGWQVHMWRDSARKIVGLAINAS